MLEATLRDFRYAMHQLRRSPGFTLTAIIVLALGIGANAAIFSVVYGLLIDSLPFRDSDRIVSLLETMPRSSAPIEASFPDFLDWKAQQTSFEQLAAYSVLNPSTVSLRLEDRAEQVHRVLASGNFFSVLGVSPLLGRTLEERDDTAGGSHVAVLSQIAWRRYFGGSPEIIGKTIELNGSDFTVVGVLPARADFPAEGEVWLPLSLLDQPTRASRVWHSVRVLGRLRPGVNLSSAKTEMQMIANHIAHDNPATNRNVGVQLTSLRDQLIGVLRPALFYVMGSVVLVLLIACLNVANLLLIRATATKRDIMIRVALGATRARLFSQHLALTVCLCFFGGTLGVLCAYGSIPLLRIGLSRAPGLDASVLASIRLSLPALMMTLGVCTCTAVLFGLLPFFRGRAQPTGRESGIGYRHVVPASLHAFIFVEVTVAVIVSFLSFLTLYSFQRLMAVDPGYRTDHLLSFEITLPKPHYQDTSSETDHFFARLFDGIRALPGVEAVAATTQVPLNPSLAMTRFLIPDEPVLTPGTYPAAQIRFVTPSFFGTMGLALKRGRIFTPSELENHASVFVVNEAFARQYLWRRDPVGAKVAIGVLSPRPTNVPVIGVVTNAHEVGTESDPPPELFLPGFGVHEVLLVRTANDPRALISAIRAMMHEMDPGQPVYHFLTMDEIVSESVALPRITALLLAIFAAVALALSAVGIYAVLAFSVVQRTREIGVRMAVGAQRIDVVWLFLRRAGVYVSAGMIAGFAIALGCAQGIDHLLYKTRVFDPLSLVTTVAALALITAAAICVPAQRAVRVNPTEALRQRIRIRHEALRSPASAGRTSTMTKGRQQRANVLLGTLDMFILRTLRRRKGTLSHAVLPLNWRLYFSLYKNKSQR